MTDHEIISAAKGLSNRSLIALLAQINCNVAQWGCVSPQEARIARAVKNMDLKALAATKELITNEISARDNMATNLGQRKRSVLTPIDEDPAPPPPSRRVEQPPPPPRRVAQPQNSCSPPQAQFTTEDRAMLRSICEHLTKLEIRRRPSDDDTDYVPPLRRSCINK